MFGPSSGLKAIYSEEGLPETVIALKDILKDFESMLGFCGQTSQIKSGRIGLQPIECTYLSVLKIKEGTKDRVSELGMRAHVALKVSMKKDGGTVRFAVPP